MAPRTLRTRSQHHCGDLILQGRYDEARVPFEQLLALRNDVGLINTALNLTRATGPAKQRGHDSELVTPSPDAATTSSR